MKAFFCNLTVAVERIMLIHSGVYGPITEALRELVSTISAPDHLFVRHHPENLGYAASVNTGFRMALDLGFERVPFVFVSNSDVRYFGSLLRELVIIARNRTRHDGVALATLRAEVLYESGKTSHSRVDVWKGHYDTGTVVTSRFLPERIRRMTREHMNSTFRRHHGMFFPHHGFDMSSFFVSHLALSVAGLLDENYFPAYGEDYDFIFRLNNLGFRFHSSPEGRFRHFVNANLFPAPLHHPSPLLWRKEARLQLARFSRMNYEYMRLEYRKQKWYYHTNIFNEVRGKRGEYPFAGRMPVDAWVRDEARIESIRLIGEGKLCRKNYLPYNTSLIEAVQP